MHKFNIELLKEITTSKKNDHSDNWDVMSRGLEPKPYSSLSLASTHDMTRSWRVHYQEKLRPILRDLIRKFYPTLEYRIKLKQFFGVEYLYDLLADSRSKELLVKLFAFRAMGHRKIRLPQSNPEHW